MRIGIDISQIIYEGTGVAEYVSKMVENLLNVDTSNEYILFFANRHALAPSIKHQVTRNARASYSFKEYHIPIQLLEFLWNRLHIAPIEWFIGNVDVFYTSDWVEPPAKKSRKVTTIHDLSILRVPETFDKKIVGVHTRKLNWVKKESYDIMCDSEATRQDAIKLLGIEKSRLHVVYPGVS
jgi:hypothetical protein